MYKIIVNSEKQTYSAVVNDFNYFAHHGIKGQKWGVRRFQNEDGSYTPAGDERYNNRKPDGSIKAVKSVSPVSAVKKASNVVKTPAKKSASEFSEKVERTKYGTKTSLSQNKSVNTDKLNQIDNLLDREDYDQANKFDGIGENACSIYSSKGLNAAKEYLSKNMQGYKYDIDFNDEKDGNDRLTGFTLKVHGKNGYYQTQGNGDYTDEQRFVSSANKKDNMKAAINQKLLDTSKYKDISRKIQRTSFWDANRKVLEDKRAKMISKTIEDELKDRGLKMIKSSKVGGEEIWANLYESQARGNRSNLEAGLLLKDGSFVPIYSGKDWAKYDNQSSGYAYKLKD